MKDDHSIRPPENGVISCFRPVFWLVILCLLSTTVIAPVQAGVSAPVAISDDSSQEHFDPTDQNRSTATQFGIDRTNLLLNNGQPGMSAASRVSPSLRQTEGQETVVVRLGAADQQQLASSVSVTETLKTHTRTSQKPIESFASSRDSVMIKERFWLANALLLQVDTDEVSLKALAAQPGVRAIHPNFEVHGLGQSTHQPERQATVGTNSSDAVDPTQTGNVTYGLEQTDVPTAWNETRGAGVQVAVLDTGVAPNQYPELRPIDGGWAEFDENGYRRNTTPNDGYGHGTHVSGTLLGETTDNGTHYGVAPKADLLHGKVLNDRNRGTFASVIAGMQWATEHEADVDVLSMSIGFDGYSKRFIEPVRNARAQGIVVITSAGNAGPGTGGSPGDVYDTIAVGATTEDETVADFSSGKVVNTTEQWGDAAPPEWPDQYTVPDVSAPGVEVLSAVEDGGFERWDGTSMAAPHVAGTAALMLSVNDDLTQDGLEEALESTAEKPEGESTGPDTRYGHGIINASAAIEAVWPQATIRGTVETEGSPAAGVVVTSDEGFSTTTDERGRYELTVPAVEQNLTVEAFGYATETQAVSPAEGERTSVSFSLDEPVIEAKTTAAPEYVPSDETVTITHRIAHADTYRVDIVDSEKNVPSNASLRIDGTDASFGEPVTISSSDSITDVNITINTSSDFFGAVELEHTFATEGLSKSSTMTGPIKIHPETVVVPDDVDPTYPEEKPYSKLQDVIDFVVAGTTLELSHRRYEADTDVRISDTATASLAIRKPLSLTAPVDTTPVIDVDPTEDVDATAGIFIFLAASETTISGITLDGHGATTGLVDAGSGVTLSNNTIKNTEYGVESFYNNTTIETNLFENSRVGVLFQSGSGATFSDNTFANVTSGISLSQGFPKPPLEVDAIKNNTIGTGESLSTGIRIQEGHVETIENNTIQVANRSGIGLRSSRSVINRTRGNTFSGGIRGILLIGSPGRSDTTIRNNEISNVSGVGIDFVGSRGSVNGGTTSAAHRTIDENTILGPGIAGIRVVEVNRPRLSNNTVIGAGIRLENVSNTIGSGNVVKNARRGVTLSDQSQTTVLTESRFEQVDKPVRVLDGSRETTLRDVTVTNADGEFLFGAVDAATNTLANVTLGDNVPMNVTGHNATLARPETPPPTGREDIGTYLELRAVGDSPALGIDVSYTENATTGLNESTLRLYTYDDEWTQVTNSTVDTDEQVVSGTVTQPGPVAPLEATETGGSTGDVDDGDGSSDGASDSGGGSDGGIAGGGLIGGGLPPRTVDDGVNEGAGTSGNGSSADTNTSAPAAVIDVIPENVNSGEEVTFSAVNSTAEGGRIVAYEWSIQGKRFDGQSVSTTFDSDTDIDVELTVITANKERDTATSTVTVDAGPNTDGGTTDIEPEDTKQEASNDSSTPGFGVLATLVAILLGLGIHRRQ
jgi:hypothetical protein